MFEVFDPRDGEAVYTVRWWWLARLVARVTGMDCARAGEGWGDEPDDYPMPLCAAWDMSQRGRWPEGADMQP